MEQRVSDLQVPWYWQVVYWVIIIWNDIPEANSHPNKGRVRHARYPTDPKEQLTAHSKPPEEQVPRDPQPVEQWQKSQPFSLSSLVV